MEILLNSSLILVLSLLCTSVMRGQQIDTIYANNISINEIGYNSPLDSVKGQLGSPESYSVYEEEEGEVEGHDKWFYFTYDSFKITFYEWNEKVYLSSFVNRNKHYKVKLGPVIVSIGDSLKTLQTHFPNSFNDFLSRQDLNYDEEEFYIRVAIVYPNVVSYDGIINIKVFESRVTEISASFRPA